MRAFLIFLSLAVSAFAQSGDVLPKIEGESFAGQKVVLPDAASGNVAVLIFGFSKASGDESRAWAAKISAEFRARNGFELWQLPVLEDVPRLVRGMVISGIKKGVPRDAREHFVPILQNEAELKKVVSYQQAADAYLVVLDRTGKVAKQIHGTPDDGHYSQLAKEIESLLK